VPILWACCLVTLLRCFWFHACFAPQAANYLNIQSLLDLTTQTVAELIKGKTPEQIRTEFGIVNDFTPEEEEEIRRDNAWSEDR